MDDFTPFASHTPEGDIIEVYLSNRPFVAEPVGKGIVIHRDQDFGDVVGFTLEGVSRIIRSEATRP